MRHTPYRWSLSNGHSSDQEVERAGIANTAWDLSGAKDVIGRTTVIADDGYRRTGLIIPHRREPGWAELPRWKGEPKASDRKVRARVEDAFAQMKSWKLHRDCRLGGDGVHHVMLGIARFHNLTITG